MGQRKRTQNTAGKALNKKSFIEGLISTAVEQVAELGVPKEFHLDTPKKGARRPAIHKRTESDPPIGTGINPQLMAVIADLASCLWDVERKIKPDAGETAPMRVKIAIRRAQRSLENLEHAGFRIRAYKVGEPFGGGSSGLKVHLQPTEGAKKETISDTVSPTIYYKDNPIQMGEVWVTIPLKTTDPVSIPVSDTSSQDVSQISTTSQAIMRDGVDSQAHDHPTQTPEPDETAINLSTASEKIPLVTDKTSVDTQRSSEHDNKQ